MEGRNVKFPADLKYSKEHAWVRVEGAEALIGITDHAQKELGDIVFVETPNPGAVLSVLKPFGVVESVKSVSDLHAPVGGTVTRVNDALAVTPEIVNKDPYGAGWLIAVALKEPGELERLMSAKEYEAYVGEIGN
jgi:glycine cleavage system H protein